MPSELPVRSASQVVTVEQKWDGQRGRAVVDGSVSLFSRNGSDISRTFPEVVAALGAMAGGRGALILDGEIVALDSQGRPCFRRLQRRWPQSRRPSPQLLPEVPVQFFVFDILERDGEDLKGLPYRQRRALLDEVRLPGKSAQIQIPPFWVGVEPDVMLDISREHGLEGIVCKRLDSPYLAGRSAHWIKTPLRRSAELVIVGWVPGGGPNARTVGSVLVGGHTPDDRRALLGQVGTGFTAAARDTLLQLLTLIRRTTPPGSIPLGCPIVGQPHWVRPVYVGTVEYREYRHDGLRHPSWKGLREIPPQAVSLPD